MEERWEDVTEIKIGQPNTGSQKDQKPKYKTTTTKNKNKEKSEKRREGDNLAGQGATLNDNQLVIST